MHHTLLESRTLSHILEQERMKIHFAKEDPILGNFPIHIGEEEKFEGNNAVMSRAYLEPHVEVEGAHAPKRGILVSLKEIPQDLICGDQGTTHDQHLPLLVECENMQIKGGDREDEQQNLMRRTHPYLFHRVYAQKRETGLCSEGKDNSVHPYM